MSWLSQKRPSATTAQQQQQQYPSYHETDPVPFYYGGQRFGTHYLSDAFNWQTASGGKEGAPWEYASIATGHCRGPIDYVGKIWINGIQMADLAHDWTTGDGDYIEYTFNAKPALGQPVYVRIYRGNETQVADAYLVGGTGQNHCAYRGLAYCVWHNIDLGQGNTSIPQLEVEMYTRCPAVGSYASQARSNWGVNVFAAIYHFCTQDLGGLGLGTGCLDPTAWGNFATALDTTGIAGRTGNLTWGHWGSSQMGGIDSLLSDMLSYVDGWIRQRNGLLEAGWFPNQPVNTSGLVALSEAQMSTVPNGGDFLDASNALSQLTVAFTDLGNAYQTEGATAYAPAVEEAAPFSLPNIDKADRPFSQQSDQANLMAQELVLSSAIPGKQTSFSVFLSSVISSLFPGDVFIWNYGPYSLQIVCRILERSEDITKGDVALTVIAEHGTYPLVFTAAPDPRVLPVPAAAGVISPANVGFCLLPPGMGSSKAIATLINRANAYITGAKVYMSPNGSSPWQEIIEQHFFAAIGVIDALCNIGDATVTIASTSVDFNRMLAQNVVAQGDDTLILFVEKEWMSVSSITVVSAGVYTLGVLRGRQGTFPAAHVATATCWLFYRSEVVSSANVEFENVYALSGAYDATIATKHFQIDQYTASDPGTIAPVAPGISFTIPNVAPAIPTGFTATAQGALIKLAWNAAVPGIIGYRVYRNTANVPPTLPATPFGMTQGSSFLDPQVTVGTTYYYWLTQVDDNEDESALTAVASAVVTSVPVNLSPCANPGAITFVSTAAATAGDGGIYSSLTVLVPALPAASGSNLAGAFQNVLYRIHGSSQWNIGDQISNNAAANQTINDLVPGASYDIALRAYTNFGEPSADILATGSPFTAANKVTGPAAVTGGVLTNQGVTPKYIPGTAAFLFGTRASWNANAETDLEGYVCKGTATDSDSATDYNWEPFDGVNTFASTKELSVCLYNVTAALSYIRVAPINTSGVLGAWSRLGVATSFATLAIGNMAAQNANAVSVSGVQTGSAGSSSIRQVVALYPWDIVVTLAGGSAEEAFNVDISNRGFTTKPDGTKGAPNVSSAANYKARYDWDAAGNSSTNAVVKVSKVDGTNTAAGGVRVTGEFFENT